MHEPRLEVLNRPSCGKEQCSKPTSGQRRPHLRRMFVCFSRWTPHSDVMVADRYRSHKGPRPLHYFDLDGFSAPHRRSVPLSGKPNHVRDGRHVLALCEACTRSAPRHCPQPLTPSNWFSSQLEHVTLQPCSEALYVEQSGVFFWPLWPQPNL